MNFRSETAATRLGQRRRYFISPAMARVVRAKPLRGRGIPMPTARRGGATCRPAMTVLGLRRTSRAGMPPLAPCRSPRPRGGLAAQHAASCHAFPTRPCGGADRVHRDRAPAITAAMATGSRMNDDDAGPWNRRGLAASAMHHANRPRNRGRWMPATITVVRIADREPAEPARDQADALE